MRQYVDFDTLRMVYFGIFSSKFLYGSQIWGQNANFLQKLEKIQNRVIRTVNYSPTIHDLDNMYRECKILKLSHQIFLQNILFVHDNLNELLPKSLSEKFKFSSSGQMTRRDKLNQLECSRTRTILYGSNCLKSKCIENWNLLNKNLRGGKLQNTTRTFCKEITIEFLFQSFWNFKDESPHPTGGNSPMWVSN